MKPSSLLAAILSLCLAGCAATQQTISGFVPDQFRGLPALGLAPVHQERTVERTIPRPKVAKPPKPEPAVARIPEPSLPPWSIPAPKPSRTLQIHAAAQRLVQAAQSVGLHGSRTGFSGPIVPGLGRSDLNP